MKLSIHIFPAKSHTDDYDEARLLDAERDLEALKKRAATANKTLLARASRNHWRESIEQMILGAPR